MKYIILLFITLLLISCGQEEQNRHFFLDEYPQLEFRDSSGYTTSSMFFIERVTMNSVPVYQVRDSTLRLYEKKSKEPYSGFVRTYHRDMYNIEAIFLDGKIQRLRFWHPNRQLGMDMDYTNGFGDAWTLSGVRAIKWAPDEVQFINSLSNSISQIITDTLTTYFNIKGEMVSYVVRTDTMNTRYYPDGTPQFQFPAWQNGERSGVVKRWHPNGQLRATGQYLRGEEVGVWTEYDSLGNVVNVIDYSEEDPDSK